MTKQLFIFLTACILSGSTLAQANSSSLSQNPTAISANTSQPTLQTKGGVSWSTSQHGTLTEQWNLKAIGHNTIEQKQDLNSDGIPGNYA